MVGGPIHGFAHGFFTWVWGNDPEKNCGPYNRWADLPMFLCMGFADGFGHDGFLSMVFCRSDQGYYSYVLIQG